MVNGFGNGKDSKNPNCKSTIQWWNTYPSERVSGAAVILPSFRRFPTIHLKKAMKLPSSEHILFAILKASGIRINAVLDICGRTWINKFKTSLKIWISLSFLVKIAAKIKYQNYESLGNNFRITLPFMKSRNFSFTNETERKKSIPGEEIQHRYANYSKPKLFPILYTVGKTRQI
ncbi:hypothetical protein EGR_07343 [Echinococcus granulosus]|uniref:Uncharacterized protein n=1 Tax=Echinococcus granulosus TaxID=6210 RepID=W6U9T6_ECHGR|nr:hypothetical protein EGR_07343 [Echinococcus granulosus]EUB57775.1 hypothetical protein EGR_07343 [Echinococcus granulosus]